MGENYKISFCQTCKNRTNQLKDTIFLNLEKIKNDGNSELILVNYGSEDNLDLFIKDNFKLEIENNILTYFKTSQKYFHMSKAKNLAHLGANGDYLFNLDCDNFIGIDIENYRNIWRNDNKSLLHGYTGVKNDGSFGRIGCSTQSFIKIGGYNEEMIGIAYEDIDFIERLLKIGCNYTIIRVKDIIFSIPNNKELSIKHVNTFGLSYQECYHYNKRLSYISLNNDNIVKNTNRQKIPVLKNFESTILI